MKDHTDYYQMGMAALLPGMQHMVTLMQRALDEMREALAQAQNGSRPKRGQQRKQETARSFADQLRQSLTGETKRSGWSDDPEERKREMERRMAARKKNNAADSFWANATAKQKKERLAKMAAGRAKAQAARKRLPVTKLQVAS